MKAQRLRKSMAWVNLSIMSRLLLAHWAGKESKKESRHLSVARAWASSGRNPQVNRAPWTRLRHAPGFQRRPSFAPGVTPRASSGEMRAEHNGAGTLEEEEEEDNNHLANKDTFAIGASRSF